MSNWLPWVVMGLGVISLFLYRYRLFLLSNKPQIRSETIILETTLPGSAPQAPAAASPQRRPAATEKVQIESDDFRASDLQSTSVPASAPRKTTSKSPAHYVSEQVWMPVAISLIVLLSALFVILSNNTYGDAQQKWAFGAVGTIIGYWFKK